MAKKNYLDFVPEKNLLYSASERENGLVTVTILHRGFFNKIAQIFFHVPNHSDIDLDQYGSFIWKQIDGTRSLFDIGNLVKAQFGGESEPLYPRLVKFFAILKEHHFIDWRRQAT